MSFTTKAIFAALALSLAPAMASAQSITIQPDQGAIINGIGIPGNAIGGVIPLPGDHALGAPDHVADCGAQRYQSLLGQHVTVAQSHGLNARYFTPDSPFGTMDYLPHRLNVSTNAHYIIDRVYCG